MSSNSKCVQLSTGIVSELVAEESGVLVWWLSVFEENSLVRTELLFNW